MKVVIATNSEDIEKIKPVALEWKEACNAGDFGIELVPEKHFSDLADLIERDNADLFLLIDDEKVVGYLGVTIFDSPLGNQKMANEHFWIVSKEKRGRGSLLLMRVARKWAKKKGCSHFIMTASNLASNLHDKVCKLYERMGFAKFETSFISEV